MSATKTLDKQVIENDKVVSIHYRLFDNANNELLDESHDPLEFLAGKQNIIDGLEKDILGLSIGEEKNVIVAAKDAYGEYDESALKEIPMDQFSGIDLKEGMTIYAHDENNQSRPVMIKSFNDRNATVDYNHPLAGKELMFFVTVASIRDAKASELEAGRPEQPESSGGCCGGGCGCG